MKGISSSAAIKIPAGRHVMMVNKTTEDSRVTGRWAVWHRLLEVINERVGRKDRRPGDPLWVNRHEGGQAAGRRSGEWKSVNDSGG